MRSVGKWLLSGRVGNDDEMTRVETGSMSFSFFFYVGDESDDFSIGYTIPLCFIYIFPLIEFKIIS